MDTPVLIRGASGTGKELVAHAIHRNSSFRAGPFLAINCSAIPENLVESELFGHERGAFTGANNRKVGKIQCAKGGTLFLDELGDMPIMMQAKLLRVLQEKTFTPVGSNIELPAQVRIITATNRPLEAMIAQGSFREDLYYRLSVMPITLPPLCERKEDLPLLVQNFIRHFNEKQGAKISKVSPEAMSLFQQYEWPGNIRELENVIEHAFILEESDQIQTTSLPENFLKSRGLRPLAQTPLEPINPTSATALSPLNASPLCWSPSEDRITIGSKALNFHLHKEEFERKFIIQALKQSHGRINQTALQSHIPKKTLLRKIKKYGILAKQFLI